MTRRTLWTALTALSVAATIILTTQWALAQASVYVTDLVLVSSTRFSRTDSDFTYRIVVTNQGGALTNAVAFVTSRSPNTRILDNEVVLGDLAGGATLTSTDTFTLRQDRRYPFSRADLEWTIEGEPANAPPVANAGPDQTVLTGTTVTLDATGSTDADGDALTYRWRLAAAPAGSTSALSSSSAARPTFVIDRRGTFVFELIVNDGQADSGPDTVSISTINSAPIADAGPDQTVPRGSTVTLDGFGSSDPDFDGLGFSWTIVSAPLGSTASLVNESTAQPTITLDLPGSYTFRLVVTDGELISSPDEVTISTENSAPVANAGPDLSGEVGIRIDLDGRASSDADGDALSFSWTWQSRPPGSGAALHSADLPQPYFTPDLAGLYVAQLIVNDGLANSVPDTVTVTIVVGNRPPVAAADAATTPQDTAVLILVLSNDSDPDGDALTVAEVSTPTTGTAEIQGNGVLYTPAAGYSGAASFTYVVSDGRGGTDSAAVAVTVTPVVQNRAPVADAGPDQALPAGETAVLDGNGSHDPDGDALTYAWGFLATPTGSTASLADSATATPSFVADLRGVFVVELAVSDGRGGTAVDAVEVTALNRPPVATDDTASTDDATAIDIPVLANDSDPDGDTLTITEVGAPSSGSASIEGDHIRYVPQAGFAGEATFTYGISDGENGQATATVRVSVTILVPVVPPVITVQPRDVTVNVGQTATFAVSASGTAPLAYRWRRNGTLIGGAEGASYTTPPVAAGDSGATFSVVVSNPGGSVVSDAATLTVIDPGAGLPPDPATVAPPLSTKEVTTTFAATSFLYTGASPIQTGVAAGTIDPRRVAVVRGLVLDRAGQPLPGATVTVHGHGEFGQTLSRVDGVFDMAVNGGGPLTVQYEKEGFLTIQRPVTPEWQNYAWLPDVVMVPLDTQVTAIDLQSPAPMQVARGALVTDGDGTRRATLLFAQGTVATLELPDGSTRPLSTLGVRATEYTVGASGELAMPGPLPASVAYTYAVDLSVDEAIAARAKSVRFSQPVIKYVENFLDFPVGSIVPVGYYDRDRAVWVPSQNGRVVRILSMPGGLAALDIDGSGNPAGSVALASLGITDAERQQLASLYSAGQSLWRVPVLHFTPYDCNWPFRFPQDARKPGGGKPRAVPRLDCPTDTCGSIIAAQNRTLAESVGITGTPFNLHYQSDRVPGWLAGRRLIIPVSEAEVSPNLLRIELSIRVAGRRHNVVLPALPNQTYTFEWGGLDAYGREGRGSHDAWVSVSYVYPLEYCVPNDVPDAFGSVATGCYWIRGDARGGARKSVVYRTVMGQGWDATGQGFGGWTLDQHHVYDVIGRVVLRGDGGRESAASEAVGRVIRRVPVGVYHPEGIAVDGAGNVFVADSGINRVLKVSREGVVETVAGTGSAGFSGDGGPATEARLYSPSGLAIDAAGNLYIADNYNGRIRRVDRDGIITTVAGNGSFSYGGDGGPATAAAFYYPTDIAVDAAGNLFIADGYNFRVRRVDPNGTITTVVGTGVSGFSGDGGPAAEAQIGAPAGLAVDADGSLFISSGARIRAVSADGIITTVAGTGETGFSGDGGPATAARLYWPRGLAVDRSGTLYIADTNNHRIRKVLPDGIIVTEAGTGISHFTGDDGPATAARLSNPRDVAVDSAGNVFIADWFHSRVRKTEPPYPAFLDVDFIIASKDGSEVYLFSPAGRILRTVRALTGTVKYQFNYDGAGSLIEVLDASGDRLTIERNTSGEATAIVGPNGQRTLLTRDGNGYLASISNPAGERHEFTYGAAGLLSSMTTPGRQVYRFAYDELGHLAAENDPAGGSKTLTHAFSSRDSQTVTITSGLTRTSSYLFEELPTGATRQVDTDSAGNVSTTSRATDGTESRILPDGSSMTTVWGPDGRFGVQAPRRTAVTQRTPAGLVSTASTSRTVVLGDPADPLSLQSFTETVQVNGRTATRAYDAAQRTQSDLSPAGRRLVTTLDVQGRVLRKDATGIEPWSYAYDTRGRLAAATFGSGTGARATVLSYNADGLVASATDPAGRQIDMRYDPAGRLTARVLPDGREIGISYNANGQVASVTPPGRPAHSFAYTPVGLVAAYSMPDVGSGSLTTTYAYNTDRQLTAMARADGRSMQLAYDAAGRLSTITEPRGQTVLAYHPSGGRVASVAAPGGVLASYTYDGRLLTGTSWAGPVAASVTRTFNNDFRVVADAVNGGPPVGYQYDADGLLTRAGELILSRSAANGLLSGTTLGTVTSSQTYNTFAEVVGYQAQVAGAPVWDVQFERDVLGRIVQRTETTGGTPSTTAYRYDLAGRLTEVTRDGVLLSRYEYDSNGNRLQRFSPATGAVAGTYDARDRLLAYGGRTFAYAETGELLSATSGGQTTTYDYDVFGSLVAVGMPDGTTIEYLTDGQRRRIGKRVNGTLVQGFVYSGQLQVIAELDGAGNVVSRFVYGTRVNVPEYMIRDGVAYRLLLDRLGSPRLVVNSATGQVVQRLEYDEFGQVMQDTNPGFQPFGFAGGLRDTQTNLVRFGARDYDPSVGRWTSVDPVLFAGGSTNLYSYAASNPVNVTDPTGHKLPKDFFTDMYLTLLYGPKDSYRGYTDEDGNVHVVYRDKNGDFGELVTAPDGKTVLHEQRTRFHDDCTVTTVQSSADAACSGGAGSGCGTVQFPDTPDVEKTFQDKVKDYEDSVANEGLITLGMPRVGLYADDEIRLWSVGEGWGF